jgi:hypothetical protein
MVWTIVGLLIATAVSVEGALSSERSRGLKLFLVALALTGAAVAGVSGYEEEQGKANLENELKLANQQAKAANEQLQAQRPILDLVNQTVGDLGTLNRLTAGQRYYVRISAGSRRVMESNLSAIEKKFSGAGTSGLVLVRALRPGCPADDLRVNCWGLVFGGNLNPAAAEVFERFANENGFPPPGQHAEMQIEPQP